MNRKLTAQEKYDLKSAREHFVEDVCELFPEHFNKETLGFWLWAELGNIALCCVYYQDRQKDAYLGPIMSNVEDTIVYLVNNKKFQDE